MKMSTGLRVAAVVLSGLIAFTLSQYLLRETTPEIVESGPRVNIHSKAELLQLLPGLGDVAGLSGTSAEDWIDGFGRVNFYDCLPALDTNAVDIAPPYIEAKFTMENNAVVVVTFGRIAPSDVQKAQDSLHRAKNSCSERGSPVKNSETEGLWTFTRYSPAPLGNASLAYTYSYKPDSGLDSSAGRIIYAISNGWGLTAATDEASGAALNSLLPRILARLDEAVDTKFLR
ncbi:hypothetical protein [Streptosporangium amethystogenes]|uniref:hypothetical protein n=1 Tax=Streptosporangium amethystogenes TaxID=2002 RepID=UPI0004C84C55|nr:hypothetical protein [Streptosporangium amethystogenes]